MAVQTTTNRITHTGNGTTTVFPYNFRVLASDHLKVYVSGVLQVLGTNYTLSGIGNSNGGNATFITAPANGAAVVLLREVPLTQLVTTENNETIFSQVFDDALDKLTMIVQQLNAITERSLYLGENDPTTGDMILPTLSARANKYLRFDANGLPTAVDSQIGTQYYGALTADPALRPDGSARQTGDLYYNSTTQFFRVFNGTGWANSIAPSSLTLVNYAETAATSKTTFTIPGGYTAGTVFIYLNGVLLQPAEFTASNGTTVVLAAACAIGDDFRCVGFSPFSVADTLSRSQNLGDLPSAATARTNLGLGSAAVLTAGTAANNAVQLDGSARLPAVDGSQLTGLPGGSGRLLRAPQILTSGTSYTTPANCNTIYVEAVGGGGGGGGVNSSTNVTAGGGGSGAYAAKYFNVSPSTSYVYAIGAGGTAGTTSGTSGGSGGNTTFTVGGTTLNAGAGTGGSGATVANNTSLGGIAGTASNGDLNIDGNPGHSGLSGTIAGGFGAPSFFGGGGRNGRNSAGGAGTAGGGGGGGSGNPGPQAGGAGGAGLIRIWEYA